MLNGAQLRDKGIEQSIVHADQVSPGWSEQAYSFLLKYIRDHREFMTEEVRKASEGEVSEPPSLRAWGYIIVRAVKAGIIHRSGFKSVSNPNAHNATASVWSVIKKPIPEAVYMKRKPAQEKVLSPQIEMSI